MSRAVTTAAALIGKRVAGRRYLHISALPTLSRDELARVEEAKAIADVREDTQFNVVRFEDATGRLALLSYPQFFDDPFPSLLEAWSVDVPTRSYSYRTYEDSQNPPILHRKELLLQADHPQYAELAALTKSAVDIGLFDDPTKIGFQRQWQTLVQQRGYQLVGHHFVPIGNDDRESQDGPSESEAFLIHRHRTALHRQGLSAPMQSLARNGFLDGSFSVFDYGCGRGGDLEGLTSLAIPCSGWDPHFAANSPIVAADIVNLGFVINVIEDFDERILALSRAYHLARQLLVVSVMLASQQSLAGRRFSDGIVTSRSTFQKYYTQSEFGAFLENCLEDTPLLTAPGVAYVFKDKALEAEYLSGRTRANRRPLPYFRRTPKPPTPPRTSKLRRTYEDNRELADALWERWTSLGRPPHESEVDDLGEIEDRFGSLKRALSVLSSQKDSAEVEYARGKRMDDLLVYLGTQFLRPGRRRVVLPPDIQRDVKAFFGTNMAALSEANSLLHKIADNDEVARAAQTASEHGLGWLDTEALHVHSTLVERLPAVLRLYVACAGLLYGDPEEAGLVKIHLHSGKLTMTKYDDFEGAALPRMIERVKVKLREQDFEYYAYGDGYEPPYLYLKSRFINEEFPNYAEQLRFDANLEALKLFDFSDHGPSPSEFEAGLVSMRYEVEGFELLRSRRLPDLDDPCGRYLTFRDLIECGETQANTQIENLPREPESYGALQDLAVNILDPVIEYFGMIRLTYGFCSPELARKVPGRVAPRLDQHAAHERRRNGTHICERLGAAVDFIVDDEDMEEVAQWIVDNVNFDRLYYYGTTKPVHISIGPSSARQVVEMRVGPSGRLIPKVRHDLSG